ncbi:MAG: GvpL/GvpF family gas vesicle protein [Lentisphaerota bacterium]|jgi:hypothetical protein
MDIKEGKYLYCIFASDVPEKFTSTGIGTRGDEIYSVCYDGLAAVLSNSPVKSYRATRDNMMAHETIVEEVMKKHTVLPVRFATIAESDDKIREILKREHVKFKGLLEKFDSKKELGVKTIFKEEVIYSEIQKKYKAIAELKSSIISLPPEKTYSQRMKIGEMVEAALKNEVELLKKEILSILSPLAVEVKVNNAFGERMIVNAAFLVEKDREEIFYRSVNDIDAKYGDRIKLKYVCEVPPFNFVNLTIKL